MLHRRMVGEVLYQLDEYPVVALLGMRQVGKTTMARQVANGLAQEALYLDLESPSDRDKLIDAEFFFKQFAERLIILDEIQIMPELFPIMRVLVDQDRRPGRFLLLGSSSPSLMRSTADSLAGRVAYIRLHPFDVQEVHENDANRLWVRGGLPLSFLAKSDRHAFTWKRNYMRSYTQRDLPQLGIGDNPVFLDRLLRMLAHVHGQVINYEKIAGSLQVSGPTVRRYIELLEQAFLIYTLTPLIADTRKRLVKSPKVYFADSGMLHTLLGIVTLEDLLGHPQAGVSWEGFVISQIKAVYGEEFEFSFFRTHQGAEVDLILTRGGRNKYAVEVKLSDSPSISKGYYTNAEIIAAEHNLVLTPGSDYFMVREQFGVVSLRDFLEMLGEE